MSAGPSDTLQSLAIADINSAIENGQLCMLAPQWWKSRPVQSHNDVCGVETLDLHYRRRSAREVHARFRWQPRSVVKPTVYRLLVMACMA